MLIYFQKSIDIYSKGFLEFKFQRINKILILKRFKTGSKLKFPLNFITFFVKLILKNTKY